MARRHIRDEHRLGVTDILDRLPWHRVGKEPDEVAGVTGCERHADLAVVLHAANAGAVAGARIDDDDRRLLRIDLRAGRRNDAHQRVVHRSLQLASVAQYLGLEVQHMRNLLGAVFLIDVAALAHDIEKQDRALPCVQPVILNKVCIGPALHHSISCNYSGISDTSGGTTSSASVAAITCSTVTPGAVSRSVATPPGNAMTASSVTTRSTGRIDVSGRSHSLTILDFPRALCCMATITRLAPHTRSMAPPMPGTMRPGIIQFASRPA